MSVQQTILTFYHFVALPDHEALRQPLLDCCNRHGVKGTLLLAPEGINGTIAGHQAGVEAVLAFLQADDRFADLTYKTAQAEGQPFYRMKVRLKREIVTMGRPEVDPTRQVGTYVEPTAWNALIARPDVTLIDTRNAYEVAVGTFQGAVDPQTTSFREFPDYVEAHLDPATHKKVALYCTGGIRCEKATAYLLDQGFEDVYHLKGGILKYLETVDPAESLWEGECFVFDQRVAVGHGVQPGAYTLCYACRHPLSPEDRRSPVYEAGVACPHCHGRRTDAQRAAAAERQRQMELAEARGQVHIAQPFPSVRGKPQSPDLRT